MFKILKPVHSESRTVWTVFDDIECEVVGSIELGNVFQYLSGSQYKVIAVDQPNDRVIVQRIDRGRDEQYVWYVASLFAGMKLSI